MLVDIIDELDWKLLLKMLAAVEVIFFKSCTTCFILIRLRPRPVVATNGPNRWRLFARRPGMSVTVDRLRKFNLLYSNARKCWVVLDPTPIASARYYRTDKTPVQLSGPFATNLGTCVKREVYNFA